MLAAGLVIGTALVYFQPRAEEETAPVPTLIYTRRHHLSLLAWLDICLPTMLVGQAIGRWGNFFNQEAYGRPTNLPWGRDIASEHRIPPYNDLQQYPPSIRFHPTFLWASPTHCGCTDRASPAN